jgi:hypothetical protein
MFSAMPQARRRTAELLAYLVECFHRRFVRSLTPQRRQSVKPGVGRSAVELVGEWRTARSAAGDQQGRWLASLAGFHSQWLKMTDGPAVAAVVVPAGCRRSAATAGE